MRVRNSDHGSLDSLPDSRSIDRCWGWGVGGASPTRGRSEQQLTASLPASLLASSRVAQ